MGAGLQFRGLIHCQSSWWEAWHGADRHEDREVAERFSCGLKVAGRNSEPLALACASET